MRTLIKIPRMIINYIRFSKEKKTHFRSIEKMREGCELKSLTSLQKKEIFDFFGKKISLKWHEYYYSVTGKFSVKYIPTYLYYTKIYPKLNDQRMMVVYSDKNMIDKLITNPLLPQTYVKNINGVFYDKGKQITFEEAARICSNLDDAIIKHSIDTCQGKSVSRFTSVDGIVCKKGISVTELLKSYDRDFIVQAAIQQDETMASLNPTSLNTVRIMTYRRLEDVVVLFAVVRMGRMGAVVDNASAGGFYCGINPNGTLKEFAYTLTPFSSSNKSDNGIIFKEFRIPRFEDMKEKAKQMHLDLPYAKIIGWDLALNDKGEIVLVEINAHMPGLFQAATGPAFGEYTDEILKVTGCK